MEQTVQSSSTASRVSNPVMEPGPLSETPTGTWRDFVTVTKIGITLANMMTVFAGLWLASDGQAAGDLIFYTLIGTALVIMAGTCLNNYIDRDLDKNMERTQKRALPSGRLNATHVLWLGVGFALVGTLILTFLVNALTAFLGLIGLFVYVVMYTMWLKRSSTTSTVWGGISGAVPIVMGWTAFSGTMDFGAWMLFLWMFLWQPPHFLALAIRRAEDYGKAGIPLLPVVKGFDVTKRHMIRYVSAMVPVSFLMYLIPNMGYTYLIASLILGFGWLGLSIAGFVAKDTIKWSRISFVYSLIYLTVLSIVMIVEPYL
ncbi:protoheme IX farnesyltransferase [Tumebacillus sp. BK434]|uniref:heme o synthase n=1 Tax=Tumebacillus sp. BK434 TaxID=2512169 RepID=UPI0010EC076D|nr:heme o synthase [Tumebacillus sp. BK434]TCP55723.1 protoheme IX farnesyltransferase [Tumebacillus sp. BK434]